MIDRLMFGLVPLIVLVSGVAEAAETGDLRGQVEDQDGLPVPNAKIRVEGASIAGSVEAVTDDEGRFSLLGLPTGRHTLTAEMGGFKATQITVTVRLDESAFIPVVLAAAGAAVEIVVEAALPVIDTTRSAISTELTAEQLANLPTGRSYQDAVNMIPGVYGRVDTQDGGGGSGNPSVRGEGSYGNNYFVDGISTRDPATKTFGANVNFDAIQSMQIYTDGAPAEFGEFTGMLVNVETKDGGDEHHGSAAYYLSTPATGGTYLLLDTETGEEVATDKREFLNHEVSLTLGGPIVKEKLWYFGSLDLSAADAVTEGVEYATNSITPAGFLKFTWFATPDLSFAYQAGGDLSVSNNANADALVDESATSDRRDWGMSQILTTRYRPDAKGEVEFKLATNTINIDVVPASGDEDAPQIFDAETGIYYNNHSDFDYNSRWRSGGSLKVTRLAKGFGGEHKIKFGTEAFYLTESRELVFTGPGDGVSYTAAPDAGFPCTDPATDPSDCLNYTERTANPAIGHTGITTGTFLQDDWRPIETLTFNVGVRVDTESLYGTKNEDTPDDPGGELAFTGIMPAPRLGMAWDVTGDSKTLFSVNAGRYYDIAGNDFAAWADTRSSSNYALYENDGTGNFVNTYSQDSVQDPLVYCTEKSLNDYFNGILDADPTAQDYVDAERAKADKVCGDGLKPYHSDKIVVGFEREVLPLLAVGIRGIYSETKNIPEDVDITLDTWVIANVPEKERVYRALEFTLERKYDEVWQALASYTLSESLGTNPGQFELATGGSSGSNGNEVGVYLDDINDLETRAFFYDNGYGWLNDGLAGLGTVYDDAGYYGYLPYHSFHQVKVNGSYTMPWGTTAGVVYEFDSGHAWQKRGYVPLYGDYFGFPEGRGSRFMPAAHYVDFKIAHSLDFKNDRSLEVSVDLFNLPDAQTPIGYYENDNESFGKVLYRQSPRSLRAGVKGSF